MKHTFGVQLILHIAVGLMSVSLGLAGCANIPYVASDADALKLQGDVQTGSNLARRDKNSTGAREVDKDALESSLRGTNANRDNGR